MEVHRLLGDRDPQPGTPGTAAVAQRLDAPAGLVAVTHARGVLVLQDRLSKRLEQRHEACHAVAQRAGGQRQPLPGQPIGHPVQRPVAHIALEQHPRPHRGPVRCIGEQPIRRGSDDFPWHIGTVAAAAPAATHDAPCMRLHVDLHDPRATLAIGHIGRAATAAHPRLLRRFVDLGPFLKRRPRRAPMPGRAGLLAAPALRTRLVLLLASATVQPLRQHRTAGANLGQLRLQSRFALLPFPYRLAQPGIVPGQRPDGGLVPPRAPQRLAQLSRLLAQPPRQALPVRTKPPELPPKGFPARPRHPHRPAQPCVLLARLGECHAQRHRRAATARVHTRRGQQFCQPLHLLVQENRVLRRAADRFDLLARLGQLLPIGLEPRLQGTELGPGRNLRPPTLFGPRFGRLRARHFPLMAQAPRRDLIRPRELGIRGGLVHPPNRRQSVANILRAHGHARNHSGIPIMLPDPQGGFFAREGQARLESTVQSR